MEPKLAIRTLFLLASLASSQAQIVGQIESMKLLTSEIGWASTNRKLFWTIDNGAHWKDITPRVNHKTQMISSVFFLDTSRGWVLLSCGYDKDALVDDVCFEFALTSNAGQSWSIVHPKIVDPGIDQSNI